MSQALEDVVGSAITPLGLELFELRLGGGKGGPLVDVRVERADGETVTVETCARASRAIEERLDALEFGGRQYVLEVSSPGLERPLRNAADWRKFVGRAAVVTVNAAGDPAGRRTDEVKIAGVEGGAGREVVTVRGERGEERRFPLAAVEKARLAFHWKR